MANSLIDFSVVNPEASGSFLKGFQGAQALAQQQAQQQRQNALADIQLRGAQRGEEEALAEREAYKGAGNLAEVQQRLMQAGLGKQSLALQKQQQEQQAARVKQAKDALDLTKSAATSIFNTPDPTYAKQRVSELQKLTGQDMSGELAQIDSFGGDSAKLKNWAAGHALDISHMLAKVSETNLGGVVRTQMRNPITNEIVGAPEYTPMAPQPEAVEMQKMRIAQAGKPSTTVVNIQEKAELGARGKMLVGDYQDVSKAAKIAAKSLPSIDSNLTILNQGFNTGFGTDAKAAGAKVLASLGVPDAEKYASNAQSFLANASQAVLQRQLEQKGPQTEADAQRITQTGAQLGNTKRANEFLLSVAKAQLKRDLDQRNFYDKWWKENKTYDGAESAWFAGEGSRSLFDRPELKQFATGAPVTGKQPAAAPAAGGGNWKDL